MYINHLLLNNSKSVGDFELFNNKWLIYNYPQVLLVIAIERGSWKVNRTGLIEGLICVHQSQAVPYRWLRTRCKKGHYQALPNFWEKTKGSCFGRKFKPIWGNKVLIDLLRIAFTLFTICPTIWFTYLFSYWLAIRVSRLAGHSNKRENVFQLNCWCLL